MRGAYKIPLIMLVVIGVALFLARHGSFLIFDPAGAITAVERNLIILAVLMMFAVAVPMFILFLIFSKKYRVTDPTADYAPNLDKRPWLTALIWAIPVTLIGILAVVNWQSTHALDPSQAIASANPPLTIEVVAIPWKFLFIYPAQKIATVNVIEFPENTPLHFVLTGEGPMSSFWIPQLGSQIYAMPAMTTQLNLIANTTGDFRGMDTEINGAGFSGMKFMARSVAQPDFDAWVTSVERGTSTLDLSSYAALASPSENNPVAYYASVHGDIYDTIVMKYMMPTSSMNAIREMDMTTSTSNVATETPSSSMPTPMSSMPGMSM